VLWNSGLANRRFDVAPLRAHPRVAWSEISAGVLGLGGVASVGSHLARLRPGLYFSPFYLAPFRPGCPVVLTLHDVLPLTSPSLFGLPARAMFRLAMARARSVAAVVTSSEFARGEIARTTSLDHRRVKLVRPGAPAPRFSPAAPPGPWNQRPYALVVGINKPHKNLERLAEAWGRFGETPPMDLVSAGPIDRRYPDLASLAGRHGARRVTSLGPTDEPTLDALYAHAALVLFPSLHEGFGFPLAEAMARGRAVIASDIPSLRELAGDAARLVPAHDAAAWHRAIGELAVPGARAALERAAVARAAELSYARCADAMLALWREVAA
jgi:alpha-1,3-rhamnosyl/mannosyltransferase